ncbi:hypothetical protein [Priestia megaterium]|uniref:hypothetical protein n=1 Tax=Priestia megaterium TaxID=1404 RepID=UPI00159BE1F0|nr:hypothetical protein [Priestia megaterium]
MNNKEAYLAKIQEIAQIKQYDKQRKQMHEVAEAFGVKFTQVFKDVKEKIHHGKGF